MFTSINFNSFQAIAKRLFTLNKQTLTYCLLLSLLLATACSKDSNSLPAPASKEILRQNATGFYQALYSAAQTPANRYVAATYVEHQLGTGFSLAGLKAYAATRAASGSTTRPLRILRTLVQGNLVGLHMEEPVTADSSVARLAMLRFDESGKIIDHWEALQGQPRRRANPNTMFDGAAVNYQSTSGITGRDVAVAADQQAFNHYDTLAVRQSRALVYTQHNPLAGNGAIGLIQLLLYLKSTGSQTVMVGYQRLAEGDFVLTMSNTQTTPAVPGFTNLIGFDLIRLNEAGKDAEHWDVLQEIIGVDKRQVF